MGHFLVHQKSMRKLFLLLFPLTLLSIPPDSQALLQAEVGGQILSLFHRLPALDCGQHAPYRAWASPYGNWLHMKNKNSHIGFNGNAEGLAGGFDFSSYNWVFGFGGVYNRTHIHGNDGSGSTSSNGLYGGAFADALFDAFYLGASVVAGVDSYNNDISKSLDLMGQIALAYLFGSPYAYFYPYANVDYLYLKPTSTLRSELGLALQVQDVNRDETICFSPKLSLGWVNLLPLHGWHQNTWNLFAVEAGLKLTFWQFALGLEYGIEFSPDNQDTLFDQKADATFSWKW